MSVPSSIEELIQLIRKSGMIDEQKLSSYLQRRQFTRGLPTDPREFADEMVQDGVLTYFQAEQFLLGKWRGFTIGKFKLLERVGVGGMGQVFLCEHMFMRRRVAIKVLPPAKAEQPAALGRFYREARAAGGLEHPNIIRTLDIDQDGNLHFIIMEYVDGSNLLDIVKKFGPMGIHRATHYIRQCALGLDCAFRNGVVHRDIKPGNVLIDRKGIARVLDLGLARFFKDHTDQLTIKYDDKIVLGTADYVAPEQVANSHSVDIRADIYGLGATFYFLLAGHPPFPNGTVSQKLLWHRTKEPTPICQVRPEVPEGLATLVAKMMAKDPRARHQTPAQLAAELEHWVPATITLPPEEEMPILSPAATEILNSEEFVEEEAKLSDDSPVGVDAATPSGGTALMTEPRTKAKVGGSPFGPPATPSTNGNHSPWPAASQPPTSVPAKSSSIAAVSPSAGKTRVPESAKDTLEAQAERTPGYPRVTPQQAGNPFPGGDLSELRRKKISWPLVAIVAAAIIAAGAFSIATYTSPKPASSPSTTSGEK